MIEAATIAAIASGMPIMVIAVTVRAAWKDGFILFIPSYLRQDLAAICGGARKSVRQANRMTRGKFAIAGANLTSDSRYRVGTSEQQRCTASGHESRILAPAAASRFFGVIESRPGGLVTPSRLPQVFER
ncbi:MAG: hypothetical protein J0G33_17645 [Afipia felis]|nr:hypothetical protein [Afipia felis]